MIGVPTTSRTTRMPLRPDRVLSSLSPGQRARGRAAATIGGQAEQAQGAEQGVADQRPPADAGLLDARRAARRASPRGPRRRSAAGWRFSTISWSPISLRAHWIDADADEQQRDAEGEAEGQVGGAEAEERVAGRRRSRRRSRRRRTASRRPSTSAEQHRDLPLGALLGRRVDVGRARLVLGQTRVGDRLVARTVGGATVRSSSVSCVAHASRLLLRSSASVWAAIQTAKPTRRRCRPARRTRPSLTGPRPPRPKPP